MVGTLDGIKVVDLSRVLAGPWASQLLADLGADVIKIERPGEGDDTRQWAPPSLADGTAAYFLCTNRGKRSITVDITTTAGQAIICDLVRNADVLIENYKVGGLARYQLDYPSLAAINPRLIYCSITGFGQDGPYADMPGYDYIVQGMSGLMSITGPVDGEPHKVGVAVTDLFTGLYASNAIMAALLARHHSGLGQYIDMALFDCAVAMLANVNMNWLIGHQLPPRLGNAHPNIVPYQVFATQDAGHFILACGNDRQFRVLAECVGHPEWAHDERFMTNAARVEHRALLIPMLHEIFVMRERDEWLALFDSVKIPCGPINTVDEALHDPQIKHRGLEIHLRDTKGHTVPLIGCPIKLSANPIAYSLAPPKLGQHTEDVLRELGHDSASIAQLRQQSVI